MTKVFIGMPVYNGAPYLQFSIESLINQSFQDWSMLISDNGSTDETQKICMEYANKDSRIKYCRQEKNIGASNNFKYLLDQADLPYFMWAAADDVWDTDFLASCVQILDTDPRCGMAFCNIVNIDSYGRIIRFYPNFERFSHEKHYISVLNYLFDPEIMGKANLIYSLYRLDLCKKVWHYSPLKDHWGSDMCFVLAALSRSKLIINNQILFKKRVIRLTDTLDNIDPIIIKFPLFGVVPLSKSIEYFSGINRATSGTSYHTITFIITFMRIIIALYASIINVSFLTLKKLKLI